MKSGLEGLESAITQKIGESSNVRPISEVNGIPFAAGIQCSLSHNNKTDFRQTVRYNLKEAGIQLGSNHASGSCQNFIARRTKNTVGGRLQRENGHQKMTSGDACHGLVVYDDQRTDRITLHCSLKLSMVG